MGLDSRAACGSRQANGTWKQTYRISLRSGASASALSSLPPSCPPSHTHAGRCVPARAQEAALHLWFGDCLHPRHPVSALASGTAGSLFPSGPQLTSDPWSQTEQDSALFLHRVLQKCERTPMDASHTSLLHKAKISSSITRSL